MRLTLPLDQMTIEEKLTAIEDIWVSLEQQQGDVPSPEWHAQELADTEQRIANGESKFIDWDEAKEQIRQRIK